MATYYCKWDATLGVYGTADDNTSFYHIEDVLDPAAANPVGLADGDTVVLLTDGTGTSVYNDNFTVSSGYCLRSQFTPSNMTNRCLIRSGYWGGAGHTANGVATLTEAVIDFNNTTGSENDALSIMHHYHYLFRIRVKNSSGRGIRCFGDYPRLIGCTAESNTSYGIYVQSAAAYPIVYGCTSLSHFTQGFHCEAPGTYHNLLSIDDATPFFGEYFMVGATNLVAIDCSLGPSTWSHLMNSTVQMAGSSQFVVDAGAGVILLDNLLASDGVYTPIGVNGQISIGAGNRFYDITGTAYYTGIDTPDLDSTETASPEFVDTANGDATPGDFELATTLLSQLTDSDADWATQGSMQPLGTGTAPSTGAYYGPFIRGV